MQRGTRKQYNPIRGFYKNEGSKGNCNCHAVCKPLSCSAVNLEFSSCILVLITTVPCYRWILGTVHLVVGAVYLRRNLVRQSLTMYGDTDATLLFNLRFYSEVRDKQHFATVNGQPNCYFWTSRMYCDLEIWLPHWRASTNWKFELQTLKPMPSFIKPYMHDALYNATNIELRLRNCHLTHFSRANETWHVRFYQYISWICTVNYTQ